MVLLFCALTIIIIAALSVITCCVTYIYNYCYPHQPTCSARYAFEVDANDHSEGDFNPQDVGTYINDNNSETNAKDDMIMIQMQNLGSRNSL